MSRVDHSREYVCDGCSSVVASAPVFRRLLGGYQFAEIWNGPVGGAPGPPCCFCGADMESRTLPAGRAALCHTCQVLWFDREALESLPAVESVAASSAVTVSKCPNCGAPVASPLDDCCRYCGALFESTGACPSPIGS